MGQYLAGLGLVPDVVLVSSARRTRETWAEIAADLGNAAVCFEARLYLADAATITQALSDRHGTVLVIGHNPGLQELGLSLLYAGHAPVSAISRLQTGLPTSGAAVFLIDDEQRPSYDGLFYPRDIR